MKGLYVHSYFRRNFLRYRASNLFRRQRFSVNVQLKEVVAADLYQSSEKEERPVLESWQKYRMEWNKFVATIEEDKDLIVKANNKLIDTNSWLNYLNFCRRKAIKEPFSVFTRPQLETLIAHLPKALQQYRLPQRSKPIYFECHKLVTDLFFENALKDLEETIAINKILSSSTDLRLPHEWYPHTRLMKRKIIYHGGPTNSGKTYQAMQRLKLADPAKGGGLYCGPLRLLAAEIYERLNKEGIYCDLITGQEQRYVPGATHTSCTVETVNINQNYDVAVVDEIQMLGDGERGRFWTRVVLGIKANEVHVCGGIEAAELVESLCKSTGDDFQLINYDRLSELIVEEESLRGDYSKVQSGDCIVAFTKLDIFAIKREIEASTKHKCAVIYGQLPPETRSDQARLFNDYTSGYDVLVASDAIGMGLNLNIRRIIFHTTLKTIGNNLPTLFISPSQIKQIAGRAGRKSSIYPEGKVTTWQEADLAYVKAIMNWHVPKITAAGLFPAVEQIQVFFDRFASLSASKSAFPSEDNEDFSVHSSPHSSISSTETITSNDPLITPERKPITSFEPSARKRRLYSSVSSSSTSASDSSKSLVASSIPVLPSSSTTINNSLPLGKVIGRFVELSRIDNRFFISTYEDLVLIANWLHTLPLTLVDRFTFASAPVNTGDVQMMHKLYHYAALYAYNLPVSLKVELPKNLPRTIEEFSELCLTNNTIELYLWLGTRFPNHFLERDAAMLLMREAIALIDAVLVSRRVLAESTVYTNYRATQMKLQRMRNKDDVIPLPPIEYGEKIRQEYMMYYLAIPKEIRYLEREHKPIGRSHFSHNPSHLRLHRREDDEDLDRSEIYVNVKDLDAAVAKGGIIVMGKREKKRIDGKIDKQQEEEGRSTDIGGLHGKEGIVQKIKRYSWKSHEEVPEINEKEIREALMTESSPLHDLSLDYVPKPSLSHSKVYLNPNYLFRMHPDKNEKAVIAEERIPRQIKRYTYQGRIRKALRFQANCLSACFPEDVAEALLRDQK